MHIYIRSFRVTYATNFTPRCLSAVSLLYLPSKLSEAFHIHLGVNELHTRLPEKPWKAESFSALPSVSSFWNLSALGKVSLSITKMKS